MAAPKPQRLVLKPVLTGEDDLAGFGRPWDPDQLVLAAFFGGELAGGALVAFNFRRLGLTRWFLPALGLFAALGLALWVATLYLQTPAGNPRIAQRREDPAGISGAQRLPDDGGIWIGGGSGRERPAPARPSGWIRFGKRTLVVLCAFLVTRLQKRRFRLYVMGGGKPGSLLLPGFLVILAFVILFIVFPFRLLAPLLP